MSKCWICGREPISGECPACGPPEPWGPTPEELANDEKTERDDFLDDEE